MKGRKGGPSSAIEFDFFHTWQKQMASLVLLAFCRGAFESGQKTPQRAGGFVGLGGGLVGPPR